MSSVNPSLSASRDASPLGPLNGNTAIQKLCLPACAEPESESPRVAGTALVRVLLKIFVQLQQLLHGPSGLGFAPQQSATRGNGKRLPVQARHAHSRHLGKRLFVIALREVFPHERKVHPVRVMRIQIHRAAHQICPALEIARVHVQQPHGAQRVRIPRVHLHGLFCRGAKCRDVLSEKVNERQHGAAVLVGGVEVHRAPCRFQSALQRSGALVIVQGKFMHVHLRQACPHRRMLRLALHESFQAVPNRGVLLR